MAKACLSFNCIILFALIVLGTHGSSLRTIFNGFASSNGITSIKKDSEGFYVEVDFVQSPTSSSQSGKMFVSVFTPYTVFTAPGCLGFGRYDCASHKCDQFPMFSKTINDPYFNAETISANIEAYLDHKFWHAKNHVYLTKSCSSPISWSLGAGRLGVIGLGMFEMAAYNHRYDNPSGYRFSIYMPKDLSIGHIFWGGAEDAITRSARSPITLVTSDKESWITPPSQVYLGFPKDTLVEEGVRVTFDIISDTIVLPLSFYNFLTKDVLKEYEVYCNSNSLYKPVCQYYGQFADLPILYLRVQGKEIPIPPEVYAARQVYGQITLYFKATNPKATDASYIHPSFAKTIFLDHHFLSHYYTAFKKDGLELYEVGGKEKEEREREERERKEREQREQKEKEARERAEREEWERKQREREREERERKEREQREQKEKEARERAEREEQERKEREQKEQREKEAREQAEKEEQEQREREKKEKEQKEREQREQEEKEAREQAEKEEQEQREQERKEKEQKEKELKELEKRIREQLEKEQKEANQGTGVMPSVGALVVVLIIGAAGYIYMKKQKKIASQEDMLPDYLADPYAPPSQDFQFYHPPTPYQNAQQQHTPFYQNTQSQNSHFYQNNQTHYNQF